MSKIKVGDVVFVMARVQAFDTSEQMGHTAVVELYDAHKQPMPGCLVYLPAESIVTAKSMIERAASKIGVR